MQYRLKSDDKIRLVSLWETGSYNFVQLSEIFNITPMAVGGLLKRRGYQAKSQSVLQRKYACNENFFDLIDTEEKAYVLGLLYADGHNNEDRNSINLSLVEYDVEILKLISNIIQPSKPLQHILIKNNAFNQYRLVICSHHMSQQLTKLGCVSNKTHKITFPTSAQVPVELQRHFVRGYFDGDGCISGVKKPKIDIVGTIPFLETVQNIFKAELGINISKLNQRHKDRDDNIRCLQVSGRNQIHRIKDWMYQDATIYLTRKLEKFNASINIRNAGLKIPEVPVEELTMVSPLKQEVTD